MGGWWPGMVWYGMVDVYDGPGKVSVKGLSYSYRLAFLINSPQKKLSQKLVI